MACVSGWLRSPGQLQPPVSPPAAGNKGLVPSIKDITQDITKALDNNIINDAIWPLRKCSMSIVTVAIIIQSPSS